MVSHRHPSKGRKALIDWVFGERLESDNPLSQGEAQQSKFELWTGLFVRLLLVIVAVAIAFNVEDKLPLIGPLSARVWWAPHAMMIGLAVVLIIADLVPKRRHQ